MKVIVGLGNPGDEYQKTRHNVGFMVVDALLQAQSEELKAQNHNLKFKTNKKFMVEIAQIETIVLVKPQTYMNRSGEAVQKILAYFLNTKHKTQNSKFNNLFIIHDDLDIKLGEYKIQFGKGPKVHNGVASVERALGTKEFWRVRFGIENRVQGTGHRAQGEEYVLQPFTREEWEVVDTVIENVVEELTDKIQITKDK